MCVRIFVYACVCMNMHICIYLHLYINGYTPACICVFEQCHRCACIFLCICMRMHMCVCMYVCAFFCSGCCVHFRTGVLGTSAYAAVCVIQMFL